MRNTRNAGVIGVVLAGLVAAGCSGGQSDLQRWIEATKKKPGGRIQALPEVKPYETYVYSASKLRSPFQPLGAGAGNGQASLRPSSRRNRPDEPPSSATVTIAVTSGVIVRSAVSVACKPWPPPSATIRRFTRAPGPGAPP